ncbi:hypothetical protein QAD02_014656 [Eretmocerus hayati]|uniref:Uncharacterized protein n=1 Tax=Eretmocerus hayati TaxID=131215 RepID=A0ACC2P6H0_9HYME|nr:hypothetical protein QAD02_014656 [Eretmocerus hayati]
MASSAENGNHEVKSTRSRNRQNISSISDQFSIPSTNCHNDTQFLNCTDLTAGGSKKFMHGNAYQLGLLTLVASRALKMNVPFYLISEAEEFDKFDDVVIDYGERMTILQVKHNSKSGKYTEKDFCKRVDGDASLAKYFDSWIKFKESSLSKTSDGNSKAVQYIFFTNRRVENFDGFLEETSVQDDDFLFEGIRTQTLKFKKNSTIRSKFMDAIRAFSQEIANRDDSTRNIDIAGLTTEITEAAKKLYEILLKFDKDPNSDKYIDARSKISMKAMALIRLARNNQRFQKLLIANMRKDTYDESGLSYLLQCHLQKIKVNIKNEVSLLSNVMQEEMDEFLNVLLIKVGQPDQQSLIDYVQREIQLNVPIAPNEFYNAFSQYMMQWFSDRLMCTLKSQSVIDFIRTEIGDLNRFYALGDTRAFEAEYNDYPFSLSNLEDARLYEFLSNENNDPYIACISGPGVQCRVYSTIQSVIRDKNMKSGDWIYMTIDSAHLSRLPDILCGRNTHFVILNLVSWSEFERRARNFIDVRRTVLKILREAELQTKKLILLFEESNREIVSDLIEECEINRSPLYIQVDRIGESQLKGMCLKDPEITTVLCGKEYRILDLIESANSSFKNLSRDLDFLNDAIVSPGSKVTQSGLPYDVYVANDLLEGIAHYDPQYVITNTQIKVAVIQGSAPGKVIEYFDECFNTQEQTHFIKDPTTTSDDAKFRWVRSLSNISNYRETLIYVKSRQEIITLDNVSYIIFNFDDSAKTMTIACNPGDIKLPPPTSYSFYKIDGVATLSQSLIQGGKFSILSAPAGYGKSSFCLNMQWEWFNSTDIGMPMWMININLPKVKFDIADDPSLESVFTKSSTGIVWTSWQISCLLEDMMVKDRVMLLLDSFDEVKNEDQVKSINVWLSKLPNSVSVLITTRPHAINEILLPESRNLNFYFSLKAYTEDQRDSYIEHYVAAIVKDMTGSERTERREARDNLQGIALGVSYKLSEIIDKRKLNLLGIPLESYLFCESLKLQIRQAFEFNRELVFEDFFDDLDKFNTIKLYEVFVREKLILFFIKHKQLTREAITRSPHDIYTFSSKHTEIISLVAFNQTFRRKYNFISDALSKINYSTEIVKEMDDIGLVQVEQGPEIHFKFIHETYQEYFAAIYVLQNIISTDDHSVEVKNILEENRYDLRYRLIFCFMAQLSVNGNALVPTFDVFNERHAILFWKIICKEGDIMGSATASLFNDCLGELTKTQKIKLKNYLVEYEWSSTLVDCIGKNLKSDAVNDVSMDGDDFGCDTAPPIIIAYKRTETVGIESKLKRNKIKSKLRDRKIVESETRNLLRTESLDTITKTFEEIIEENSMDSHYWDINGGFRAMALLGNGISGKIAEYFIERISSDPTWRAEPALNAIYPLLRANLNKEAKKAVTSIISCIVTHRNSVSNYQSKRIEYLIHNSAHAILESLAGGLNEHLRRAERKVLFTFPNEFKHPILMLKTILWIAARMPYAVVISDDGREFKLIRETIIHVSIQSDLILGELFTKILSRILLKLKRVKNKYAFLNKVEGEWRSFVIKDLPREMREYLTSLLRGPDFEKFYKSYRSSDFMPEFFKKQEEYSLVSELSVAKLTEEIQRERAMDRDSYWSLDGGIEVIGYVGKFFNKQLADYLILRSKFWNNNHGKAVNALRRVYNTLKDCHQRDEYFQIAVSAYNQCITHIEFSSTNLERIQVAAQDEVSPMDTN